MTSRRQQSHDEARLNSKIYKVLANKTHTDSALTYKQDNSVIESSKTSRKIHENANTSAIFSSISLLDEHQSKFQAERNQRLSIISHGNRNYNIITGANL